ncbi:hypothetical protein CT0861_03438 [Colletotrichum tofieldiae]|uniref:Uncharacterized protein n=1 Tax=Colletotrichum tofieldiae TaxID=708197 RepID=A0A166X9X7_9PEZI|nr:hypothetical protein CT0861_03438 [Colletotrichum tofieldiae]
MADSTGAILEPFHQRSLLRGTWRDGGDIRQREAAKRAGRRAQKHEENSDSGSSAGSTMPDQHARPGSRMKGFACL